MKKKYPIITDLSKQKLTENEKSLELILNVLCEHYQLERSKITGRERYRHYVIARQVFFYLAKKYVPITHVALGIFLNKDHTTVISSVTAVEHGLFVKDKFFADFNIIEEKVKQALSYGNPKILFTLTEGININEFITTTTAQYEKIQYEVIY